MLKERRCIYPRVAKIAGINVVNVPCEDIRNGHGMIFVVISAFVTKDNINSLLLDGMDDWDGLDILHIDIDGNDYWIWKEIEINPAIVIMEYNSNFGIDRAITIPYAADFYRTNAHYSNILYINECSYSSF